MVNEASRVNAPIFYADQAYDLRAFAKPKRYTLQEITAFEVGQAHADRHEVEAFIAEVFYQAYGAKVKNFMPKLIALRDDNNHLMAAFGMREASVSPLFLEQYVDDPIEVVIERSLCLNIQRAAITEIGNLAVVNPRNAGILISHVIEHSINAGVQLCVATAHHTLQNGLIKGGCDVFPIHAVDVKRLPATEQADWGSYYDNQPQIIAVRHSTN